MIGPSCKKQFAIGQFHLTYNNPQTFITSQWQKNKSVPNNFYLAYRISISLLFTVTWILSILDIKKKDAPPSFWAKWLIYLTNWGYTICTFQALLAAAMLSVCVIASRLRSMPNLTENALKLYKVYWVTNTIGTSLAFGITTMYWSFIYDAKSNKLDAMNYFVHGNNSVLMMIDLWVVSHPIRVLHFVYPVLLGICYALFSVIYYFAGGTSREEKTYIYTILNWDNAGTTFGICIAVMAFLIVLHILTWAIHKLRIKVSELVLKKSPPPPIEEDTAKEVGGYDNEGLATKVV